MYGGKIQGYPGGGSGLTLEDIDFDRPSRAHAGRGFRIANLQMAEGFARPAVYYVETEGKIFDMDRPDDQRIYFEREGKFSDSNETYDAIAEEFGIDIFWY